MADGTGYELTELYGSWHSEPPLNAKRAICRDDRRPWMLGGVIVGRVTGLFQRTGCILRSRLRNNLRKTRYTIQIARNPRDCEHV